MPAAMSQTETEIKTNILEAIGNTPLVRLNRVSAGLPVQVLAKLEFMNPGGSVKDRIGMAMIEAAEREGKLKPGGTIVECTGGNTGLGLALAAAIKGYRAVFVMPDKMSDEKIRQLRAFGARVVITPSSVAADDPRSYHSVARRIAEETPNALFMNQFWNEANPQAHYATTGPEIWRQSGGRVRAFFAGMGTGGTISGVGRYLKEQDPSIVVVGVDPVGSLLYHYFHTKELGETHSYKVEGVGEDFLPGSLHWDVIDDIVQVDDRESFRMARRMVREEGLFSGGSAGMAVAGAIKWLRLNAGRLAPDDRVVVLLPDSGGRYLSKIFDDAWMRENGFLDQASVADLVRVRGRDLVVAHTHDTVESLIRRLKERGISQIPVLTEQNELYGLVSERDLLSYLMNGGTLQDSIATAVNRDVTVIAGDTLIEDIAVVLSREPAVVVTDGNNVTGIITRIDLIDVLTGTSAKANP